jgi:MarR family transcriptional regulator, 2-MHQ and catechol-resistance regulon repressor
MPGAPSSRSAPDPAVGPAERDALKLWVVLSRAHAAITDRAAEQIARYGMTLAEFGVLEALFHKGPLLLGEVQRKLLVSSGGVTYLVDRLERRGLVRRDQCLEDRRARYAVLTDEGTAFVQRVFPEHAAAIRDAMAGLDGEDQLVATQLIRKLGLAAAGAEVALEGEPAGD